MSMRGGSAWNPAEVQQEVKRIIRDRDFERLVRCASEWAWSLARGRQEASKAQIRKIFGELKQIEMQWRRDARSSVERLRMLKPRLAYAAARPNVGEGMGRLRDVLSPAIDAVLEAEEALRHERFRTLMRLTEALLAYFSAQRGGG